MQYIYIYLGWSRYGRSNADASANTLASSHTHPPLLCCLISFASVQGFQLVKGGMISKAIKVSIYQPSKIDLLNWIKIENNIIIDHLLSGFEFSIKRRPVSSSKFLTTNLHFLRMTSSSLSLSTLVYLLYLLAKFPLTTPFSHYSKNTRVYIF